MIKVSCGILLSLFLLGSAHAVNHITELGGLSGVNANDNSGHAGSDLTNSNFGAIKDKLNSTITQLNNNSDQIESIKTGVDDAKAEATRSADSASEAQKAAGNAQEAAKEAQKTAGEVVSKVDKVQETVSDVQGKVNQVIDKVDDAYTNSGNALDKAKEANSKADETTRKVDEYQTNTTNAVKQFQNDTETRVSKFEQTTNDTVGAIRNEVGEVRAGIQGAINDSASALVKANNAESIANDANFTAKRVENGLAQEIVDRKEDVERGVKESKAYTDSKFNDFATQIEGAKKHASAGTAAALAASQIPQVSQGSAFSLGLGMGNYGGQSALSLGMSARLGDYTVTKFAVTSDTQNNVGAGVGIAVEW